MVISAFFILSAVLASAQVSTITYPIAELGNCENKSECHTYCDSLSHISECVAFAETHGLMSVGEAREAREFARLGGTGPGGCTSKESCESYCEDTAHIRQCLSFAKQAGIMSDEELAEAEKVATYLESGGSMPGGCRGEKECRAYCEGEGHMEECVEFAVQAGFMNEKEVEMFRKTGGTGPGGCRGRACEAYCEDESHREQCIAFAMEHNLMSEEDKERMAEGMEHAKAALEKAPPEVLSCIEAAIGSETLGKIRSGEGFVSPRLGEILPQCFREVMGGQIRSGPFGPSSAAADCMRTVFGDDFEARMRSGELDPSARENEIRACMQAQMGDGFLNDQGQWERPESGDPQRDGMIPPMTQDGQAPDGNHMFEEQYRREYHEEYDARRMEMEALMRAEIESQMRSGSFDPSRLPPDFRPEGYFPPPESYQRPGEGGTYYTEGVPQGYTIPQGDSMMMPPPDMQPPPESQSVEPVSLVSKYLANVLIIVLGLIGMP